ncbi:MAG: dienelactone hydrolase family protein [Flavobacteriaceae bacterium]
MNKILLLFLLPAYLFSQTSPKKEGYTSYNIKQKNDTINFFLRSSKKIAPKHLFILIEGSAPMPINMKVNGICCSSYDIINSKLIPKDYAYVVIAKHGYSFYDEQNKIPKNYWKKKTLDFRVHRVDEVIKYVKKNIFSPKNVVIVGISQGSDVVAKLGTINKDVTHIGFWAGGGYNPLTDFLIMARKDVYRGKITEDKATKITDSLLTQIDKMYKNPSPNKFWDGNSYLSYVSFSEAPIDNLLKIDIPIFVAIGTSDENVPVESAYIIPIEFMKHKKKNLTFKYYPKYDHGFVEIKSDSLQIDRFDKVTKEFINWLQKN